MSIIYPNFSYQSPQINFIAPFQNVYNNMKALTSSLIQSRIIQRNLVYIIGLSPELIKIEPKLKSYEYFGQYGKIIKLVVNKNKTYNTNGPNGPSYTCFITYSTEAESSLAILSMDNYTIDNHEIKANYGTTKYCINFLRNSQCRNKECIFLHKLADEKDIVSREQMNSDKDIFPQQRIMAIKLSKILTDKKYKELYELRDIKTVFPNGFSVYKKELIIRYVKGKKIGVSLNLNSTEFKLEKIENKKEISTNDKEKETKLKDDKQIIIKEIQNHNKIIDEGKTLFKNYFDFKNNLNSLFKSAQKSRFNFAKTDINNPEKSQLVPSQINDFLSQQFMRHSNMFQEEQTFLTDYYFSLKQNSLDSNESWSSLISTLKKWNDVYENSDEDNFNKFNTY